MRMHLFTTLLCLCLVSLLEGKSFPTACVPNLACNCSTSFPQWWDALPANDRLYRPPQPNLGQLKPETAARTSDSAMVGPAQAVAYQLRVLHAWSVLGRAMVRVALGRRFRSSRASQQFAARLLLNITQILKTIGSVSNFGQFWVGHLTSIDRKQFKNEGPILGFNPK